MARENHLAVKRSFAPVADARTRLLVLGSLPGEESLSKRQYYGNPRNHFWRLMSEVTGADLVALGYEARLAALIEARVGLWDVIGSARRQGSLDGKIRDHSGNDLAGLVATLPELRAVAFNGGTSARLGRHALEGAPVELVQLPSSSPAYTLPFEEKRAAWLTLRRFLEG
jgi:hypoxanthine-DNA glycosylase